MNRTLPSDPEERKRYAEELFEFYDKDKSGFLEINEMLIVLNDIMESIGSNHKVNKRDVVKVMELMDDNKDYRISKT